MLVSIEYEDEFKTVSGIIVPIAYAIVFIAGLIGISLELIIALKYRKMKTLSNQLIVALALADLSFLVFCVPFSKIANTVNSYPYGNVWCKISSFMIWFSLSTTVYVLCLMSLDRFVAIVFSNQGDAL